MAVRIASTKERGSLYTFKPVPLQELLRGELREGDVF